MIYKLDDFDNWEDMKNKVINCDALELLKKLPDNSVDLVLTDPPYGTQSLAGGYGRRQLHDKGNGLGRTIKNDNDLEIVSNIFNELIRVIKDGWIIMFYSSRKTPEFIKATSSKLWYGSLIWDKKQPGLGFHIRYAHEDIAVFRIGNPKRPPNPILSVIREHGTEKKHPHQKPIKLINKILNWASSNNCTVLDPFMGSFSTAKACQELGRDFIGCDLEMDYCRIGEQRLAERPLLTI